MSEVKICTMKEAIAEVNRPRKFKTSYRVWVKPFLPTSNEKGFQGLCSAKVTKKEFIKVIENLLEFLEDRGAKVELSVPTGQFESFYV